MRTCCTCPDETGLHTPGPRHPLGQPDRLGPGLLSAARLRDPWSGQQHSCLPASEVPSGLTWLTPLSSAADVPRGTWGAARAPGQDGL